MVRHEFNADQGYQAPRHQSRLCANEDFTVGHGSQNGPSLGDPVAGGEDGVSFTVTAASMIASAYGFGQLLCDEEVDQASNQYFCIVSSILEVGGWG